MVLVVLLVLVFICGEFLSQQVAVNLRWNPPWLWITAHTQEMMIFITFFHQQSIFSFRSLPALIHHSPPPLKTHHLVVFLLTPPKIIQFFNLLLYNRLLCFLFSSSSFPRPSLLLLLFIFPRPGFYFHSVIVCARVTAWKMTTVAWRADAAAIQTWELVLNTDGGLKLENLSSTTQQISIKLK